MNIRIVLLAALPMASVLSGCATVPVVSRPYYFPEGRADIVITQTLGCITSTKVLRSMATATVAYTYPPNYKSEPHWLTLSDLDFVLSDSDAGLTVTDDGRLASINSVNAGQTAAIVKSAVSIAAVLDNVKPQFTPPVTDAGKAPTDYCAVVADRGVPVDTQKSSGDTKKSSGIFTLTLTYKQRLTFPDGNKIIDQSGKTYSAKNPVPIPIDPAGNPFTSKQTPPSFSLTLDEVNENTKLQPVWGNKPQTGPFVEVPTLNALSLVMSGPNSDLTGQSDFWSDIVLEPTNTASKIPIPKAPWFGKLTTSVQFATTNSGLVTKVEYNKTNGLSDLFTAAAQPINQAFPPPPTPQTEAQKAAATQAQADQIYQQQRLVVCQLAPSSCPRQ